MNGTLHPRRRSRSGIPETSSPSRRTVATSSGADGANESSHDSSQLESMNGVGEAAAIRSHSGAICAKPARPRIHSIECMFAVRMTVSLRL